VRGCCCAVAVTTPPRPIALPRNPEPPPPHPFPVIATVAPVLASAAIWTFTQSPFAMVFALLGPVVAVASLGDSRRQTRRQNARERNRFHRELDAARRAIAEAQERERDALTRASPSAARVLADQARDPERWRGGLGDTLPVTLGTGRVASCLVVEPGPPSAEPDSAASALEELRATAAFLDRAPVVVDARLGIGLCGSPSLAAAAANAIIVQLANALPPSGSRFSATPDGQWSWLAALPQWEAARQGAGRAGSGDPLRLEIRSAGESPPPGLVVVAVAEREGELPRECRVVLRLDGASAARLVRHPDLDRLGSLVPEFVSTEQARDFAALLRSVAEGAAEHLRLPESVPFSALTHTRIPGRGSLACAIGVGAGGRMVVDLVADGPHAVIGGTTGSGKSELLVSWVLGMAAACSPEQLNVLLVDFKGGSSFAALRDLPHCVGLVTDLDEAAASRAMLSLRAELRHRERVLSEHTARSLLDLGAEVELPRLVIVVDEFQALTASFPELHELFADLAARGRSLGVHLILCTQRPAGAVRDAVLANCTLRMSLRVNNRADSVAVIGSPAAAELPRSPAGRALLAREDGECAAIQLAIADGQSVASVAGRWSGSPWSPRRPWLDPLPAVVDPGVLSPLPQRGVAFALMDLPELQRQSVAFYDPDADGSLLVVGGHRSGKTGVLAAIAKAVEPGRVDWAPASVDGAWDAVTAALEEVRSGTGGGLLLVDDLDVLLGRFPQDYEQAFLDSLAALLREGRRVGLHLVLSASRVASPLQSIASLCGSRLVLRMPDRQEHLVAGGSAAGFDPALRPGAGHWGGHRVQVAFVEPPERAPAEPVPPLDLEGWPGLAVVANAPQAVQERLRGIGTVTLVDPGAFPAGLDVAATNPAARDSARPRILLGDPDAWLANWGLVGRLRASVPVAFHGCSVADFRAISHLRTLPPPVTESADALWLLLPDGAVRRTRLI
jgi:DNA segregation ATPase FtsK/SpoIIIE and related proteins